MVLPPKAPPIERHDLLGWLAHRFAPRRADDVPPLMEFLAEMPPRPSLWRADGIMLNLIDPMPKARVGATQPACFMLEERWWKGLYQPADGLSLAYGDRFRSSYVLIIAIAFLALMVATISDRVQNTNAVLVASGIKFLLLISTGVLTWDNLRRGRQERWFTYKLLAELCHNQMVLAPLGRTLPGAEIHRSAAKAAVEPRHTELPREAWVAWYFLAALRSAPLPQGNAAAATARTLTLGRSLVAEQTLYHRDRRTRMAQAEHRLARLSEVFFSLTVLGLLLRFFFLLTIAFLRIHIAHTAADSEPETGATIETAAILFSGLSAAFVGLRENGRFGLLARQSLHMQALREDYAAELDNLSIDHPLATRDLGALLHRLVMTMMQEVGGWAQLFR